MVTPHVRRDSFVLIILFISRLFQSTRPVRARPGTSCEVSLTNGISIHVPRVGHDFFGLKISGHSMEPFQSTCPVWGTTTRRSCTASGTRYFNPCAPCGARPDGDHVVSVLHEISIHVPLVGHDQIDATKLLDRAISIHTPEWGVTITQQDLQAAIAISIHTPRVERDGTWRHTAVLHDLFQSAHPVGGVTVIMARNFVVCLISILTPQEGVTTYDGPRDLMLHTFQSTCPVWGTTRWQRRRCSKRRYFNPRAPCGARPGARPAGAHSCHFNPRARVGHDCLTF